MSATPRETFELFLDDDRYAVPTLHLIVADDEASAVETAHRLLAESIHHLGAELCLNDLRIAGIGSFATRALPFEVRNASEAAAG